MLTIVLTSAVLGALAGAVGSFFALDHRTFRALDTGAPPRSASGLHLLEQELRAAKKANTRVVNAEAGSVKQFQDAHLEHGLKSASIDSCAGTGARLSAIKAAGINTMWDLSKTTPAALDQVPGVGPASAKIVFDELARVRSRLRSASPSPATSTLPEAAAARRATDAAREARNRLATLETPTALIGEIARQTASLERKTTGYRQWRVENRPASQRFDLSADEELASLAASARSALANDQLSSIVEVVPRLQLAADRHRSAMLSATTEGQQAPPPRRALATAAAAMALAAGSIGVATAQPGSVETVASGNSESSDKTGSEPGRGESAAPGSEETTTSTPAPSVVSAATLDAATANLSRLSSIRRDPVPLSTDLEYSLDVKLDGSCMTLEDEIRVELAREVVLSEDGCSIIAGEWRDAETGESLPLEMTRVLPVIDEAELGESGADRWTPQTVRRFADEQLDRRAFAISSTTAATGTFRPATCSAALQIVEAKQRWGLSVESAEIKRLRSGLAECTPGDSDAPNPLFDAPTPQPPVIELIPSSTTTTSSATSTSTPTTGAPTTAPSTTPAPTRPPTTVAPTTAPQPRCDPNYTGCVPIDSDVDCSSGSGNGPSYAHGPIQVIGRDIYDLDRDNDGIACENG